MQTHRDLSRSAVWTEALGRVKTVSPHCEQRKSHIRMRQRKSRPEITGRGFIHPVIRNRTSDKKSGSATTKTIQRNRICKSKSMRYTCRAK
jgi:hypothetical protein